MKHLTIAIALLSLTACKTPDAEPDPPAPVPETTAPTTVAAEQTPEPAEAPAPAPTQLPGTPHDEEHVQISLTWTAATGSVQLLTTPAGEVPAATVELTQGDKLEYEDSVVLVTEGTALRMVKDTAVLRDAATYAPESGSLSEASRDVTVSADDTVAMLKYAGEGTCYVQVNATFYLATCPEDEFTPAIRAPKSSEWWAQVKTDEGTGWLKVDDRIEVEKSSKM